jgi:carboxymethylenebutenolidase
VLYDAAAGPDTADFANTTFPGPDGEPLLGYLARPEGPGEYPAVLLIHEWWGLNQGITIMADALAREGYVVLAPDAYRGQVTDLVPRALWLRLTTPQPQIEADLDAALAHLGGLDGADPARVASMGFCFGGGQSLQLGLRQSENLAVTLIYYGAVVTDPDLLRPLQQAAPVLGVFAEEDQQIFVGDVLEFEAALNTLGIENQITIYPGVGHAFINEENFNQPGIAGDAWQEALDFLRENLGDPP